MLGVLDIPAPLSKGAVPCLGHLGIDPSRSNLLPQAGQPCEAILVLMDLVDPTTAFFSIMIISP